MTRPTVMAGHQWWCSVGRGVPLQFFALHNHLRMPAQLAWSSYDRQEAGAFRY